jgi:hypothetical protein
LLPDDSAGRIARALVDESGVSWFSMLTYHLEMNNRPVGGRRSETFRDIIIIMINVINYLTTWSRVLENGNSHSASHEIPRLLPNPKALYPVPSLF